MRKSIAVLWFCLLLAGTLNAASDLRVSANGHYLGTPLLLLSDTEWMLKCQGRSGNNSLAVN
jgi:hypothetical protein